MSNYFRTDGGRMIIKDKKGLSANIQNDIDNGVFDLFPKLKERLQFIGDKLIKAHYCENVEISSGEYHTLKENEYVS